MFLTSLVAVSFLTLWPGFSGLSGTWATNLEKSEFELASPGKLVVHLSQTASHLAVCEVTTDSKGTHVSFWEHDLTPGEAMLLSRERVVLTTTSIPGTPLNEEWRLLASGELVITRSVFDGYKTVNQQLVLKPSTDVIE